jgi:site-specific DNA-methyltransferase (adenine-specific)
MTKSVVLYGEAFETLRKLADNSVDAVVCDPPYGLSKAPDPVEMLRHWLAGDDYIHQGGGFMGKSWDSFVPGPSIWRECLRVLKPGGHMLVFGGTRTYDLLVLSIRLANFDIRDTIAYMYGSGFPKGTNVSKAIDKAAGAKRKVVGTKLGQPGYSLTDGQPGGVAMEGNVDGSLRNGAAECEITAPATPEAQQWEGWNTSLKPAHEPICVARKPLVGTIVANVLEHGTGALNVDGCRAGEADGLDEQARGRAGEPSANRRYTDRGGSNFAATPGPRGGSPRGRWPANVVLDEEAAAALDEQTGELKSGANPTRRNSDKFRLAYGDFEGQRECEPARGADSGGASRFYYCAKSSTRERNEGLPEGMKNTHATVKPLSLMRYLVRLVTSPEGRVLDPYCGSGTTGCAAALEGMSFIGIDNEEESVEIARARIAYWKAQ